MMVRTSAGDYAHDLIYMTAVDTGWQTLELPAHHAARVAAEHNFQTPIDEVDAAARSEEGGGAPRCAFLPERPHPPALAASAAAVLDPIFAPLAAAQGCTPPAVHALPSAPGMCQPVYGAFMKVRACSAAPTLDSASFPPPTGTRCSALLLLLGPFCRTTLRASGSGCYYQRNLIPSSVTATPSQAGKSSSFT